MLVAGGAGIAAWALPAAGSVTSAVTVTDTSCASQWGSASTAAGTRVLTIASNATAAGGVDLQTPSGGIVAEVETLAPSSSDQLTISLSSGTYQFYCYLAGLPVTRSLPLTIVGKSGPGPVPVDPVTVEQLAGPNNEYRAYAARQLSALAAAVTRIEADLSAGNLTAARSDWLAAQLSWELAGASYDSFGPLGQTVDGLQYGLADGVSDRQFTGLHRLEYGLWHGQAVAALLTVTRQLALNVSRVQANLDSPSLAGDPTTLPIRAHEILEDALRDHLSRLDDEGAGAEYPETYADAQVTRTILTELAPLISVRAPSLIATADKQLDSLQSALLATTVSSQWRLPSAATLAQREKIDSAIGAVLATLSAVPDILQLKN